MGETTSAVPNPGSDEAVARGCICPVLDNAGGRGVRIANRDGVQTMFWINGDCPLHAPSDGREALRKTS